MPAPQALGQSRTEGDLMEALSFLMAAGVIIGVGLTFGLLMSGSGWFVLVGIGTAALWRWAASPSMAEYFKRDPRWPG